ncbi:MAG: hypothetical protein IKG42_04520 [Clostridia bacterium]|nr:hypothetical protein [Clostridia bacterium]
MEFKKCPRCGNFYVTENDVCHGCTNNENLDVAKLKGYFEEYGAGASVQDISIKTGINSRNLNRYLENEEFASFGKTEIGKEDV